MPFWSLADQPVQSARSWAQALDLLNGVLDRMDGYPTPKDWVKMFDDTTLIVEEVELLISLVELGV